MYPVPINSGVSSSQLEVKNPPANAGDARDAGSIPGSGRSPGEGITTHSSIIAWEIPWTEEPRGPWGHKEVGHNEHTHTGGPMINAEPCTKITGVKPCTKATDVEP